MTTTIRQFAQLQIFKNSLKVVAAGSLAVGVAAMIPAAPAGAVLLNTGNFAFSDGTGDFFTTPSQNSYTVNFNPLGLGLISSATGAFGSAFTVGATQPVATSSGTFNLVSGDTFSLASALNFGFNNGVTIGINPGSTFTRTFNNTTSGVGFASKDVTGTVTNIDGTVNLTALSFIFNDNPNPGGGGYSLTLSPTNPLGVPEPFSVIGTIVGGTAAFRMRKKLVKSDKD